MTEPPTPEERATGLHHALADPGRAQIVRELKLERAGLGVDEFARRLRLHPNTVRWHLHVLEEAGMVAAEHEKRTTGGRPRLRYRLTSDGYATLGLDDSLLTLMLAGVVERCGEGAEAAERVGFEWGRYLVERPAPSAGLGGREVMAKVADVLAAVGFACEPADRGIRLRRSHFDELVRRHPEVVAALLRGIVSGALSGLESGLEPSAVDLAAGLIALTPTSAT